MLPSRAYIKGGRRRGRGIEEGEDNIEALKRECMEEIGCTITNVRELGVIEEYRN